MTPQTIGELTVREQPLLRQEQSVREAVRALLDSGAPALPVVDEAGRPAGVFGEREFIRALFPGYVGELRSARFVPRAVEKQIEKRAGSRDEPVSEYMTTDAVAVGPDYSDIELAETFLHHRVSVVPVTDTEGGVRGFVTRTDFFGALVAHLDQLG